MIIDGNGEVKNMKTTTNKTKKKDKPNYSEDISYLLRQKCPNIYI